MTKILNIPCEGSQVFLEFANFRAKMMPRFRLGKKVFTMKSYCFDIKIFEKYILKILVKSPWDSLALFPSAEWSFFCSYE